MIKKIIHYLFYTKPQLIRNIEFLQSELAKSRTLIRTLGNMIEREREYNLNTRMRRRNVYWRKKNNKQFKMK